MTCFIRKLCLLNILAIIELALAVTLTIEQYRDLGAFFRF
ncbi:hypothetical protein D3OALGA1CA_2295 [Olavius algarvensis associated proteobacterium Delta 3]|nr:hypothetical protein D3OALGA1CA_2295 [Olavius algarvensis associated proteobacterium Delta 3]